MPSLFHFRHMMHNCTNLLQNCLESQCEPSRGTVEADGLFRAHQYASLFHLLNFISYTSVTLCPTLLAS